MRIQRILSQHRSDFTAMLECEHCGATKKLTTGYDDNYYHTQVLPSFSCGKCGRNRAGAVADNPDGHMPVPKPAAPEWRVGEKLWWVSSVDDQYPCVITDVRVTATGQAEYDAKLDAGDVITCFSGFRFKMLDDVECVRCCTRDLPEHMVHTEVGHFCEHCVG